MTSWHHVIVGIVCSLVGRGIQRALRVPTTMRVFLNPFAAWYGGKCKFVYVAQSSYTYYKAMSKFRVDKMWADHTNNMYSLPWFFIITMIIHPPPYIICSIDKITNPFGKLLDHCLLAIRCTHNTSILSNAVWKNWLVWRYTFICSQVTRSQVKFVSPDFPSFFDLEIVWPTLVCTRICKWDERNILKNKDKRNPLFSIWPSGACDHTYSHQRGHWNGVPRLHVCHLGSPMRGKICILATQDRHFICPNLGDASDSYPNRDATTSICGIESTARTRHTISNHITTYSSSTSTVSNNHLAATQSLVCCFMPHKPPFNDH